MTDETAGYLSEKWSNLKDDGTTASNTGDAGVDTDFPLFRLADVYLMYAECVVRLHNDWDNWGGGSDATDPTVIASRKQGAIYWINQLRERAGASDVWSSNFADDDAKRKRGKSVSTPASPVLDAVVPSSFKLLHFSER